MSMEIEKGKVLTTDNTATPTGQPGPQQASFWHGFRAHQIKRGALLYWAILLTMSAAIMHFVAVVNQLPPSALLAVLLIGLTLAQAAIAVTVTAAPTRRALLLAGAIEGVALLAWLGAHVFGLPDGFAVWRPETLEVPDLYLPIVEALSAGFFLSLGGRTWETAPRAWRLAFTWLPRLLLLALLIGLVLKSIAVVVFFLVPGALSSLQYFFLPVVVLLAVFLLLRLVIRSLRARTPHAWRTTFTVLPAFLILGILTWGGGVSAISTAWLSNSPAVSVAANQTATITYCNSSNGSPMAMDISEPSAQASRPAPVVLYIHGGETLVGSRILIDGSAEGVYLAQLRANLLARGFVVGAIDYGLVPLSNIGDQVRAARCAVRFLRAHAATLGIDPQRIGVYGPSQGGYISAMLGTTASEKSLDVGQYLNESSSVQAVVDMWGPTDISNFSGSPGWAALLVGHGTTAQLRSVSPLYHVAHSDPPFLIIQGADDWFIAPHHSQDMARALQAAGVPVTLVMVQHDGHGLAEPTAGQVEQPSPATLVQMIANFFSKMLAVNEASS